MFFASRNSHSACDSSAAGTYSWTSFNMVEEIQKGTTTAVFTYTPEHDRFSQAIASGTTEYMSDPAGNVMAERFAGTGSATIWRTYLIAYGRIVAERFTQGASVTMDYLAGDHLASTVALTNTGGQSQPYAIGEEDSYDAWGKRRAANGNDNSTCSLTSATLRGYTGQEMMDSFCLVNLNARMYDPWIGRFISADSMVPNPLSGQSFNRYSYVENNPLARTDPSGHDGNAGGGDGPPCWYCVGTGLTNDVVGNPVPAQNYGGGGEFSAGWNTNLTGWNGEYMYASVGMQVVPNLTSTATLDPTTGTLTVSDFTPDSSPAAVANSSGTGSASSGGLASTMTSVGLGYVNGVDTVVNTCTACSGGGSSRGMQDLLPGYFGIVGQEPHGYFTRFFYQLYNKNGQKLTVGPYWVTEHIFNKSPPNAVIIQQPQDEPALAQNGVIYDDVGLNSAPTAEENGAVISVDQIFTVNYNDTSYILTTEFQHETFVSNGVATNVVTEIRH